jgi:membrane protein DedA with SNARE-associated domain
VLYHDLHQLVSAYGYWAVFLVIAAEGIAIPAPGEAILVAAAIFAGRTHNLDIGLVILDAIVAAVCGNLLGYWVGQRYGYALLLRYGRYIRLDEAKLKLGQYLFWRHGGKIVVVGRFIFFLRIFGGVLAGVNRMGAVRFSLYTAVGTTAWALVYGLGGYFFGHQLQHTGVTGWVLTGSVILLAVIGFFVLRAHWDRLQEEAERRFPGPLDAERAAPHRG